MMASWERSSCSRSTGIAGTRSSPCCSAWIGPWSVSIRSSRDGPAVWRPPSSGSSSSSPGPCPRACLSRRPTGPSGSPISSSIRPRRDRRSAFAPPRTTGVRSKRYRKVAAGGAEPTRESCRGRHAQAPGPREVRRSEHDADETPDTCSSRSPAFRERHDVSRTTFRPQVMAPSVARVARHTESIGTNRSDSRCSKPSPGWIPSSCRASGGTNASQSAIATFG